MAYSRSGSDFFRSIPPVTKNLVIVNLLCWLASVFFPKIQTILGLHLIGSEAFMPHQLLTYMFMHDNKSITHLLFNMFAVVMFGQVLEQVWGSKRFLLFYLVTGIGAGLVQQGAWYAELRPFLIDVQQYILTGDPGRLGRYWNLQPGVVYPVEEILKAKEHLLSSMLTVGASGAVFGILLGFGMMFPNAPLYIMFIPFPIKAKWMVIGYGLVELFGGLSHLANDNVAHFAHLGGMLFGFFLIRYWKKKGIGNGFYIG